MTSESGSADPSPIQPGPLEAGAAAEAASDEAIPPPLPEALPAPAPAVPAPLPRSRMQFSASGSEYFRIWVVNLLLTLLSFGVYSAWAKVRKTRCFYQNTRLDGHAFDYHGAPLAILRGRMLAVVLLVAYSWSFDISRTVGLTTIAVLCLAGPWLFMKAQQFKFHNSSWRGLRFGFDADLRSAYRTLLPLLLVWFSGTILGAMLVPMRVIAVVGLGTGLLLPLMHHTLKRYQHSRIAYGNVGASFKPAVGRFYLVYFKGFLLLIASGTAGGLLAAGLQWVFVRFWDPLGLDGAAGASIVPMLIAGTTALVVYLGLWPYLSVRLQQVVWGNTNMGPVGFQTHIRAWPLVLLVLKCVALTVITLGLYWPHAAVALARYRIENMDVIAPAILGETAAGVSARTVAAGEGAADLFGLDVGL